MKIFKAIIPVALCLPLAGCADFVQSLEPIAEEADKAWEVIQEDLDNVSEKMNSGQSISWKDFDFIADNESLTSLCQELDDTKQKVSAIVEEAAKPIPYTESCTYNTDLSSLTDEGAYFTCMYINQDADTVSNSIEPTIETSSDTSSSPEADVCFFVFSSHDEVSYIYSRNFPENSSDVKLAKESSSSPYAVNLVRVNDSWLIESLGEQASDIDADKIISSLYNYETVLALPSEETFKSGGLYNLFNIVTDQQALSSDIFMRSDADNDFVIFSYGKGKLATITDLSQNELYMIGRNEKNETAE